MVGSSSPSNRVGMSFRADLADFFEPASTWPALEFAEVHIEAHSTALEQDEALISLKDRRLPVVLHSTDMNLLAPNHHRPIG